MSATAATSIRVPLSQVRSNEVTAVPVTGNSLPTGFPTLCTGDRRLRPCLPYALSCRSNRSDGTASHYPVKAFFAGPSIIGEDPTESSPYGTPVPDRPKDSRPNHHYRTETTRAFGEKGRLRPGRAQSSTIRGELDFPAAQQPPRGGRKHFRSCPGEFPDEVARNRRQRGLPAAASSGRLMLFREGGYNSLDPAPVMVYSWVALYGLVGAPPVRHRTWGPW
jgi:hypothetical protein